MGGRERQNSQHGEPSADAVSDELGVSTRDDMIWALRQMPVNSYQGRG